jgi:hypothetical protein
MARIKRLTARELQILKRNLHACYVRVPNTHFLASFILDAILFTHGVPWSRLRARRPARRDANQRMWIEWRAYDRFQKLVAQLKHHDQLPRVRMAQLKACCEMAAKEKKRIQARRPLSQFFAHDAR